MANTAREKEVVKRVNVDTVKANLMRPSLTAYFAVQIPVPTNNGAETKVAGKLREVLDTSKQEKLNLLCTDASLPGSQLTTMEITNDRTGVTEKHAYRRMFDDRVDFRDVADAIKYWYDMTPEERSQNGRVGHDWVCGNESNMSARRMSERMSECIEQCLENWTPRKKFSMYKIEQEKQIEQPGVII